MAAKFAWGWIAAGLMAGCQGGAAPRYAGLTAEGAREILSQRAGEIHTFTARCQLRLVDRQGQAVELDGVMVMAPPGRLRLRVWKLGQAVFDLTQTPEGLWIETSAEGRRHGGVIPAALSAGQLARFLGWFEGGFFNARGLKAQGGMVFERDLGDGSYVQCKVDAREAVAEEFDLMDGKGVRRFSLGMSDYREVAGIVWPMRLEAMDSSSTEGASRLVVVFSDVEFNGELMPGAFVPPGNAERRQ